MKIDVSVSLAGASAAHKATGKNDKLRDACEQFEAFFVSQLMKTMRQAGSNDKNTILPVSQGEKIFREMSDDETAKEMSRTGQIGLADLLYRQIAPGHAAADNTVKKDPKS